MAFYPDENSWWNDFRDEVVALYVGAPTPRTFPADFDFDLFKWWSRTGFDISAGLAANDAKVKHLRELEAALGIGQLPVDNSNVPAPGYPDENSWWNAFRYAVVVRYNAAGIHFPANYDFDMFKWWSRTGFTIGTGVEPDFAKRRHLAELRAALNYPVAQPTGRRIVGQLRTQGKAFVDDLGYVLPMFCHFGEAFSVYVRNPDRIRQELDRIAHVGYHGIRFWDTLGYYDSAWKNREVAPIAFVNRSGQTVPATPDYYAKLEAFLLELRDRQLVAHHSRGDLNSWPWHKIIEHAQRVGQLQRRIGSNLIALNESCNEAWQNGVPEVSRLREIGNALGNHALRATSAADDGYGGELPESLAQYTWDVAYCHGHRTGGTEDRVRHIHAWVYEGFASKGINKPGWQGEPAGPGIGVTVGREEHPEGLCMMAAMALMCHQAWVYMSSEGVFYNTNLDSMPGFVDVPKVQTYLPQDVMTYTKLIHGGQSWRGTRVFAADRVTGSTSHLRCDANIAADGRHVVYLMYASEPGNWNVPVERNFDGHIIHPVTGEAYPISLRKGTVFNVAFERGRILVGEIS